MTHALFSGMVIQELAGNLTAGSWGRGEIGLLPFQALHNIGNLEKGPLSLFYYIAARMF